MEVDVQKLIRSERDTIHDLSNNLVVIQGMSSLILMSCKPTISICLIADRISLSLFMLLVAKRIFFMIQK